MHINVANFFVKHSKDIFEYKLLMYSNTFAASYLVNIPLNNLTIRGCLPKVVPSFSGKTLDKADLAVLTIE